MSELMFIVFLAILVTIWIAYLRFIKSRWKAQNSISPEQYLWELRKITGKGEYELFHIAAKEKGWPENQVENHFRRFLEDQTLPIYMKQFLEEGQAYIDEYRSGKVLFFDKVKMSASKFSSDSLKFNSSKISSLTFFVLSNTRILVSP